MTEPTPEQLARSLNLRGLGGIAVDGGRTVRRGALYRSAALGELTDDERMALAALRLRSIIDLRNNREREAHPTPWRELGCQAYWTRDHQPQGAGDLSDLLVDDRLTAESARDLMLGVYQTLPYRNLEALRQLFLKAGQGEGPILFHCTSGKDRTGMSAALVLSALGAPREAVAEDYLATLNFEILASPAFRAAPPERRAALAPIYGVSREYLDVMFAAIEARDGSLDGFLHRTLELEPADLENLRGALLV